MKNLRYLLPILVVAALFTSCNQENVRELVDPADADALSDILTFPRGSDRSNGNPPSPSTSTQAPTVQNNNAFIQSSNGSTAPLNFAYANVNGDLGGCYVQIDGAGEYITVPYNASSSSNGELELPIGLPTNVDAGDFCINFCVYDNQGRVSNVVSSCVSVLRLGTGAIQISLSWDNSSDQDLYVTDPEGETISYTRRTSASGGQLDRDDTNGFGPENIFWSENAPDGTYTVEVDDYDGVPSTTFYVTVSGPNTSRSFTGETSFGSKVDVVTFTKRGDRITF